MAGSYLAESIKASRRFSTWFFVALWLLAVVVFLYALPFLGIMGALRSQPGDPGSNLAQTAPFLLPQNSVAFMMRSVFPHLGTAVALILGALSAGSEHGWGTMKMILSQKPSRLAVLSGKLLVLLTLFAVLSAIAFIFALASSLVLASSIGAPVELPPATDLIEGFGAGLLVLAVWGSLGFALGSLLKGSTIAVGLGLIYAYPVETTLGFALTFTKNTQGLLKFLPGQNANVLSSAFGGSALDPRQQLLFDPPVAALALVIYTAIFIAITALVWDRRDVT